MAAYFQLYRQGSTEPSSFQDVDNAICQNLDRPWNEDKYADSWYDIIGFRLALGKSFEDNAEFFHEQVNKAVDRGQLQYLEAYRNLLRINHFLCENYSCEAWMGR